MMNYSTEEIIETLKTTRKDRGTSQRALSKKVGIAQSHISKIENGSVDITLSTLVELARALDLEVILIPKKLIPAVNSMTRSVNYDRMDSKSSRAARNELTKIRNTLKEMETLPETVKEIQKIQQTARELSNLYNVPSNFMKEIRKVSETLIAIREGKKSIKKMQQLAKEMQHIRNRLVHAVPKIQPVPKSAYSLDEDDNA